MAEQTISRENKTFSNNAFSAVFTDKQLQLIDDGFFLICDYDDIVFCKFDNEGFAFTWLVLGVKGVMHPSGGMPVKLEKLTDEIVTNIEKELFSRVLGVRK